MYRPSHSIIVKNMNNIKKNRIFSEGNEGRSVYIILDRDPKKTTKLCSKRVCFQSIRPSRTVRVRRPTWAVDSCGPTIFRFAPKLARGFVGERPNLFASVSLGPVRRSFVLRDRRKRLTRFLPKNSQHV